MKSSAHGKSTFRVLIEDVTMQGICFFLGGREYYMSYAQFPWFKNATIAQIHNVELLHGDHLHWPDLDVDLELDSIEHPERYPLIFDSFRSKRR